MPPEGNDANAGGGAPPAAPAALLNGGAAPPGGAQPPNGAAPPDGGTPPGGGADAREWLPEAYRANPMFKDIPTIDALAKAFENGQRMIGADKATILRLPADGDEAAMAELFTKLGRPEKPDGYQFGKLPGELLEGVEPAAREAFHKLGLSATQAAGVMELYGTQVTAAQAAREARAVEMEAAVVRDLKAEYGEAFDDRLHAANRAIAEFGGEPLGQLLRDTVMPDGTRLGNHPLLVKAWAKIGERFAEPGDLRGGSGTGGSPGNRVLTPDQAKAEIARLQGDAEFTKEFMNPRHPNRAKHMERWTQLHEWANPRAA